MKKGEVYAMLRQAPLPAAAARMYKRELASLAQDGLAHQTDDGGYACTQLSREESVAPPAALRKPVMHTITSRVPPPLDEYIGETMSKIGASHKSDAIRYVIARAKELELENEELKKRLGFGAVSSSTSGTRKRAVG